MLRPVNYRNLGAEELGGIYESLLALTPQISADGARFGFAEFAGNERKTSGSYYTPDSLVQCLLDSALDPVVEEAIKGKASADAERAILALKVCDPSVGSGHFLVGAAHRLARHLSRVRAGAQGESQPSPLLYQQSLRDVIGRCLYGVDVNPMAGELCRVSLWLEALEPGKPLSFLDHHIRIGNSLLGATPDLIAGGIPDEAFSPIEGDDRRACALLKKRNKVERKGLGPLFAQEEAETQARLRQTAAALEMLPDARPEDIRAKELAFRRHEETDEYRHKRRLADAWCSAFVIRRYFREPNRDSSITGLTQADLNDLAELRKLPADLTSEIERLSHQYQFFHWHLVFPEVFGAGGFDCVLGNPPWERVKLQEKEWFAERNPTIANAANAAARKRLIEALRAQDATLHAQFVDALRHAEGESHFMRDSGLYPLCGGGDMNTYAIFAERCYRLLASVGRFGLVLPTGLVTLDTNKAFFAELMKLNRLCAFVGFDNEEKTIFPDIDNNLTFAAVVVGDPKGQKPQFCFNIRRFDQLGEPDRFFELGDDDLSLLNPNTRTCPVFRSSADAILVRHAYQRHPLLWRENPSENNLWGMKLLRMFDMATDSASFRTDTDLETTGAVRVTNKFVRGDEVFEPLYEAKMIWHFDHRWAAFFGREMRDGRPSRKYFGWYGVRYEQPDDLAFGRYWVAKSEVSGRTGPSVRYFVAFRDITNRDLERTATFAILPAVGVGHQAPVVLFGDANALGQSCFVAERNSFAADFIARNKLDGSHLTYFILKQLPSLAPNIFASSVAWSGTETFGEWLARRVLELTYTSWDLEPFATAHGCFTPPFRWDEERRSLLRSELDAAFFHVYFPADAAGDWRGAEGEGTEYMTRLKSSFATPRDAVTYIMDTFPLVKRKDEEKYGDYRTKLQILAIYDRMQQVIATNTPYRTLLDPPPADPRAAHSEGTRPPATDAAI